MSDKAGIAVVAGSGISLLPLLTDIELREPFCGVKGLASAVTAGHVGEFVHGRCGDVPIVLQNGRLHLYEGLSYKDVIRPVDVLAECGVRAILFTNAAGGLRHETRAGGLLGVDAVDLWPCRAWPDAPKRIVPDFVIDGCDGRGTYRWVHGPCYETRAEIGALQGLGGAAVGMSTAPELWRCNELGIRGGIVSCITNCCCVPQVLTHEHVVETACRISRRLCDVIRAALPSLASGLGS